MEAMMEEARSPLVAWESFYVIVGSSGAALTGLQFIVIALIAESRARAGIHNAWDAVTYIALGGLQPPPETNDQG
jgi:hypothetical protein